MTTATAAVPDLVAIKARQQRTWASGDYAAVATLIVPVAESLCDAADIQAGWRVLDMAAGSGNATLAAARRGALTVGVDYVPALLERGRARAVAEGLAVEFQEHAASELLRVCRLGGVVALANWTPEGFVGELFRVGAGTCRRQRGGARPRRGASPPGCASCSATASARSTCARASSRSASARPRSWSTSSGSTTGRHSRRSRP